MAKLPINEGIKMRNILVLFLQSSGNTMASHSSGHVLHYRFSARNYICDFRIEVSIPEIEINIKSTNEAQNKLI